MQYAHFEPDRYNPDLVTAMRLGSSDLSLLAPMIGPNKDQLILEVGCGAGNLLYALKEQGFSKSYGIEPNETLAEYGRRVLGVDIRLGEWLKYLEKQETRFDLIVALDVLEHVQVASVLGTLATTREHLATQGRLIIRVPNAMCPFVLPTFYGDPTHQFLYTPQTLNYLFREAGFRGEIRFSETRPTHRLKRFIFEIVHRIIVKPIVGALYYHFHGQFPAYITPNIICCAWAS